MLGKCRLNLYYSSFYGHQYFISYAYRDTHGVKLKCIPRTNFNFLRVSGIVRVHREVYAYQFI